MPNIQNNKYLPNPLPQICAPREKLLERIDAAAQKRLVFISAPAGSGKTVSALLWMQKSGRKTAWIDFDAFDNSVSVFYRMVCAGLLSAQPDNRRMNAILQSASFSQSPVEHTINLLSEFENDGCEYAIALDDCHTITNSEIIKSIPYILRRMPHSFVTLLLSRNEPGELFSKLIAEGSAGLIGADDLAFTRDEVIEYYALLGRKITHVEADAAIESTGGWVIGVNALSHSTSTILSQYTQNGVQGAIDYGKTLERYIKNNLWAEWDEEIRSFMLTAAILDEMPVDLCASITGRQVAGRILESLREQNAFVTRIDEGTYRYHHLFLDFLRSLPEYAALDKKEHLKTAALYYLEKDKPLPARHYAIESGDAATIADAQYAFFANREHSADEYVNVARGLLLSERVTELCEDNPVLYISCAYVSWLTGDAKSFEQSVDKLKAAFPKILLKYRRFAESAFATFALDYRTPFAKLIKQAALAVPVKFEGEEMRSVSISMQMPFFHRSTRDYYELTDRKLHGILRKTYGRLLKDHFDLIMHALSAGLCLEQNKTGEALSEALLAVSMLTPKTVKEVRFSVNMHLAAVYLALGRTQDYSALIEEIKQFVSRDARFLRPNFLAFTARVRLWSSNKNAAVLWLDNYFVNEDATLELYRLYQYFTTVRAYAVLGEYSKAKDLASRLRQLGRDFNRPQDCAEAGVLLSAVMWAQGDKDDALEMLETVLSEMQPHGFIRLIADEGAAVVPMLKKINNKIKSSSGKDTLDPVYVNSVYIAAVDVARHRSGIIADRESAAVKLSKQQKAILELYAKGYKREDLVDITGLSLNTIKTHTRKLYEKLGVNNAPDAVAKARELGLI